MFSLKSAENKNIQPGPEKTTIIYLKKKHECTKISIMLVSVFSSKQLVFFF